MRNRIYFECPKQKSNFIVNLLCHQLLSIYFHISENQCKKSFIHVVSCHHYFPQKASHANERFFALISSLSFSPIFMQQVSQLIANLFLDSYEMLTIYKVDAFKSDIIEFRIHGKTKEIKMPYVDGIRFKNGICVYDLIEVKTYRNLLTNICIFWIWFGFIRGECVKHTCWAD